MKKVYICSPLGGDVSDNLERAKQYARYVFSCGQLRLSLIFMPLFWRMAIRKKGSSVCRLEEVFSGCAMRCGSSEIMFRQVCGRKSASART